mgnify:FL=1
MRRILLLVSLLLTLTLFMTAMPAFAEATPEATPAAADPTEDVYVPEETPEPEIIVENPVDVADLSVTEGLSDQWINILLLGGDSTTSKGYARTDGMIILSLNPSTAQVKMTSLMRDTWVNLYNVGWAKLNAANVYGGPKLVMRTVNENFGMNITHYAMINMTALAEVVDKLGGIEVSLTKDEMRYVNKYMETFIVRSLDTSRLKNYGENTRLTGNQAMAFARNRYLDNDYNRTERQRKVLTAIAKKLQENNVLTIVNAVSSLLPYVETNLDMATLVKLATVGLGADIANAQQMRLPADGTFDAGIKNGTWSIRPNFEKNTQLLHDFIYGAEG